MPVWGQCPRLTNCRPCNLRLLPTAGKVATLAEEICIFMGQEGGVHQIRGKGGIKGSTRPDRGTLGFGTSRAHTASLAPSGTDKTEQRRRKTADHSEKQVSILFMHF